MRRRVSFDGILFEFKLLVADLGQRLEVLRRRDFTVRFRVGDFLRHGEDVETEKTVLFSRSDRGVLSKHGDTVGGDFKFVFRRSQILRRRKYGGGDVRRGRVSVRCPDVLSNGSDILASGVLLVLLERWMDGSAER